MNKQRGYFFSQNQSPTSSTPVANSSPIPKTQLVLKLQKSNESDSYHVRKNTQHKCQQSLKSLKTQSTGEADIKKQLNQLQGQYKDLQLKYDLSIQEIQKYQMQIERLNQKKNHEKQQLQQELNIMKKQLEHRSKSQLEIHETGILGHIINEQTYKSVLKELQDFKEKCKTLTQELDTKNIQLDYLTKKLLNTPSQFDYTKQVKDLSDKLLEKDNKIKKLEYQLDNLENIAQNKQKYMLKSGEYYQNKKNIILDQELFSTSNIQSTMSNQQDTSSQLPNYIKL